MVWNEDVSKINAKWVVPEVSVEGNAENDVFLSVDAYAVPIPAAVKIGTFGQ